MMYGILFSIVSILILAIATANGGWYWTLLWPAFSFGVVASGYLYFGPRIFGKEANGRLSLLAQLVLLPYLLLVWSIWHLLRTVKRESAFDSIAKNVLLGRRLLSHELPANVSHVVDLTSEFTESASLRTRSYFSFPILDGLAPSPTQLITWVNAISILSGTIFIHCAEGHGRSGLFAAALLLRRGLAQTPEEALQFIQSRRPLVRLSRLQHAVLDKIHRDGWPN